MVIKEYDRNKVSATDQVTFVNLVGGALVLFSSDCIPSYISSKDRHNIKDAFRSWQDKVLILGQLINDELRIVNMSIDGRIVSNEEMVFLCQRLDIPSAEIVYTGKLNEDLLDLMDEALVKISNENMIWRRN